MQKRNKKYAIGVDYGTNSVRALIVDLVDGTETATAVYNYPSGEAGILFDARRPLLARQNPCDYIEGFYQVVTDAVCQARDVSSGEFDSNAVVGIGIDTTGSTPIPVDVNGIPLVMNPKFKTELAAQAWLWKDHTALEEAAEITRLALKTNPEYLEKGGGTYSAEWYWAKIWHCLKENPEVFAAAWSWVELADFIPAFITGNIKPETLARSICAAGHKAMWDSRWGGLPSETFLASLDPALVPLRARFAQTTKTADQIAGYLTAETAAKTGLVPGIPVAVGAFDCHLGAVGAGVKPGTLVKIVGTSCCDVSTLPLDADLRIIPGVCGIVPGSVLPNAYGIEAGQSAVGDIFNWFAKSLTPVEYTAQGNPFVNLEHEAAQLKPGESGLIVLDWNNGNRCILVDQALTGVIMGTTLRTTAAETYRALVEGTAFGAVTIINQLEKYGVKINDIVVCGGVAEKSPMTMQIYADVCMRPLRIARSAQTCALGAAIFGAVVGGAFENVEAAQRQITGYKSIIYTPNPEAVEVYRKLYLLYRSLHNAFGVEGSHENLYQVMKEAIAIRESVRKH